MATNIALILSTTTQGTIEGDSSVTTLDRGNTIEVLSLSSTQRKAFDRATLQVTGRRFYEPLTFTKRIDRSTPKLRRALALNEVVTAEFRWYRPDPAGAGTEQKFLTVRLQNARIVTTMLRLPDTLDPDTRNLPPLEEIAIVFNTITWTYEDGGVTFEDEWIASR